MLPLLTHLESNPNVVLVAPPGAGKTTAVAPALLDAPWCDGQILLLSPRRLAARAAAERMAELADEPIGATIGYATRMDSRVGPSTRIVVMTEGIFRARIIADPELAGVSAVLFDEVHERNLDSDFGLALALEAQAALRPDLRILAMSATLDGGRFAGLMHGAPVVESAGRAHPLTLRHVGRDATLSIEEDVARAIRRALVEEAGDVLAFLPGVRAIERTAERLTGVEARVLPLHGQLDPAAQRTAIRRDADGARKVILATSIAETSLTIDGVRIVVDSGLARRVRFDVAATTSRLVTERASQAAATQRAGRAARQGPGIAYRLWEEAATGGMMPFDPPEVAEAELSRLVLDCAAWGERDPARLPWLDKPPAAALARARAQLAALDAIDASGGITTHGRDLQALPMPVALAHMLVSAANAGDAMLAAEVAVLLTEHGLGGRDADLVRRRDRWSNDRSPRAEASRAMARGWAKRVGSTARGGVDDDVQRRIARHVATAFPDRVARRRSVGGQEWLSAGGRGYRLDPDSGLSASSWLAIGDAQGASSGARIMSAAAMDDVLVAEWVESHGDQRSTARYDVKADRVEAVRERRLGAISLSATPDPDADTSALLLEAVREGGLALLPDDGRLRALRQQARFAGIDALTYVALLERLADWAGAALSGRRRLSDVSIDALVDGMRSLLSWDQQQAMERIAPPRWTSPAGSTHPIDYGAEAGPTVTVRVQALFGQAEHPCVGHPPVPLVLSLTSPAGRPVQTTRDLPGFWQGSWADVAREMRGRYPKHPWPDQPWLATATLRTKRADAARRD